MAFQAWILDQTNIYLNICNFIWNMRKKFNIWPNFYIESKFLIQKEVKPCDYTHLLWWLWCVSTWVSGLKIKNSIVIRICNFLKIATHLSWANFFRICNKQGGYIYKRAEWRESEWGGNRQAGLFNKNLRIIRLTFSSIMVGFAWVKGKIWYKND